MGQIPSNMILTRVRPSYYLSFWMAIWAIVSALTALARNYHGLLLTRLFLGLTEAPYYPGALYLLSTFYTRKEVATRISILYTGNILATAFAGLIAAGVFSGLDKKVNLAGWQWYIMNGLLRRYTLIMYLGCSFYKALSHSWSRLERFSLFPTNLLLRSGLPPMSDSLLLIASLARQ